MGRVAKLEAPEALPLTELKTLMKPPKYDLSAMFSQALEGDLLDSSLRDLVFNFCARGGSQLYLYDSWI